MRSLRYLLLWSALVGATFAPPPARSATSPPPKLNVLFVIVDDLRAQLGCYGDPVVQSPQIDRFAKSGLLFNRAYCQQALCSPSRTSVLTGRRPDTTKVYDLKVHFRTTIPDVVTLPEHFKKNGYLTQEFGKVFHPSITDPVSWSVNNKVPGANQIFRKKFKVGSGPPWGTEDVPDNAQEDGAMADEVIGVLRGLKETPFFLAVGFHKPHLPFLSTRKYWDLYRSEEIKLPSNPRPPKDAPPYAVSDSDELRAYDGIPKEGPLSEAQARDAIHAYYASVSYVDAQIGRLLDGLDRLGLRDKTVVVLWGDHGFHLGEHGMWAKHTNFELDTRAPLIVSVPGQKHAGTKTDALVEFVDIYPFLVETCGLRVPEGLEGTSFRPLLDDPRRPWKKAAFSQYPRKFAGQPGMGYSMRTDRYRFTEWSVPGAAAEYELYDHERDPQEDVNVAKQPEYAARVKELKDRLHRGWRGALP